MYIQIRIDEGDADDLRALSQWLGGEPELRGRVRHVPALIQDGELGSAVDLLTVAVGAGGAGSVLASSLVTWLQTRRTAMTITVKRGKQSITLDVKTTANVLPLLQRLLDADDEP
jgi:Effector Associated Constant Component 1